jgi:general stress protein 26
MDTKEIKAQLEEIENIKKVRELASKVTDVPVAMLTTVDIDGFSHSRPLQTHHIKDDGHIWFIVSKDSRKAQEIIANPKVNVTYTAPADNLYVSINGIATLNTDNAKIEELWSEMFRAWFPKGKADPNITLIKIEINHIEYWDAPDSLVAQFAGVVKATLKGNPYAVGENKNVDL